MKGDQILLPGTVTERDVFKRVMRRIGGRGGSRNTEAQNEARRANMQKAIAARWPDRKERTGNTKT